MALHVPKAPGFAQMLKDGAKVGDRDRWLGGRVGLSLAARQRPAGVPREGSRKGGALLGPLKPWAFLLFPHQGWPDRTGQGGGVASLPRVPLLCGMEPTGPALNGSWRCS